MSERTKIKLFAVLALFLFTSPAIFAMEWPSQSGVMTRNFGWNNAGSPHLGATFAASGAVAAAETGELLFKRHQSNTASRLPSTLGAWVALEHGDGLISIYSRFDNNSCFASIPYFVERGTPLGQSGISGWSSQNGFFFQFFDRLEKRWVNPSVIIRTMNPRIPAITHVSLVDTQGNIINLPQNSISQGRYTILVNAITGNPNAPHAPFRIISTLNGSEVGALSFETYSVFDGSLVVYRNGLIPARRVYSPVPGFEFADVWITRGQATLEIIAQDISGVTRNVIHRFTVE
jgi:hypothetical protein